MLAPSLNERGGNSDRQLEAEYFASVWASYGWGVVYAQIGVDSSGWNNVWASIFKDGKSQPLLPAGQIVCAQ